MPGKEIVDRAFQDAGQGVQVSNVIMRRRFLGFHLGNEAVGKIEFKGEVSLRNAPLHADLFDGMNHIPVQCRDLFDRLFGRFPG